MSREYANIVTAIWGNPDVRELELPEQGLYLQMWTHPELTYAGILDWRPGRLLAPLSKNTTIETIGRILPALEARYFVLVDHETEEILLRSYLRHDGLLKNPKTAVSMSKAYAAIGSNQLRAVIIHELLRLREEYPTWAAWAVPQVQTILKHPAIDPRTSYPWANPTVTPSSTPSVTPKAVPSVTTSATSTTTATEEQRSAATRGTRLPQGWKPSELLVEWAHAKAPSVNPDRESEKFTDYWNAKAGRDATKADWDGTWRNWMRRVHEDNVNRGWKPSTGMPLREFGAVPRG